MADYELPDILWKNSGMMQAYKDENDNIIVHKICISFGNDRVWICASIWEGEPVLKFSHFNIENLPLFRDK